MARTSLSHARPGLVWRVPGLNFVSPRLNLDTRWATHYRERHCADTPHRGTRARLLAALSQYGTLRVLEGLFA